VTFGGFPSRAQATAIPNVFFSDVLPVLADDPAAVGVALHAFNALMRKRGFPRYLTRDELVAEQALGAYLRAAGVADDQALDAAVERGLTRCVDAGVLLALRLTDDGGGDQALYFLNSPSDRRGMETVRADGIERGRVVAFPVPPSAARPGVFAMYEQEIGALTPQIIEELTEAERIYPAEWFERAFREAAAQNARSWRYVQRILERWAIEGPDHATTERDPAGGERYFHGKYGSVLRRRLER
jgi:DnaD/phage-associated family protein